MLAPPVDRRDAKICSSPFNVTSNMDDFDCNRAEKLLSYAPTWQDHATAAPAISPEALSEICHIDSYELPNKSRRNQWNLYLILLWLNI